MQPPDLPLSEYFLSEDDLRFLMEHLSSDRPDADALLEFAERVEFRAGDVLIGEDESDNSVYILADGELAVIIDDDDLPRTVANIEPYALVGEQSFIDGGPRTASVVARTDGVAHRLTDVAFEQVRTERPDLACAFLVDVARGLSMRCRALARR